MTSTPGLPECFADVTVEALALDDFEAGLLPVMRHFMASLQTPALQSWRLAYKIAGERWGDTLGLAAAQALSQVVHGVHAARGAHFEVNDPLDIRARGLLTGDEAAFLAMIRHMRRDETPAARDAVAAVTGGRMDAEVIRAGLSFARRFPCGAARPVERPRLRAVG